MKFMFLEHTADIKFQAYGKTINELFKHVAEAFSHYITHRSAVKKKRGKTIVVSGTDYESLLYNFLDELIYLIDAENFVATTAEVKIQGFNLKAKVYGDDVKNYDLNHVKAATYAEMYVKKKRKAWEAQAVIDV
ncbi:archease [Candidatus Pacearchaeota archaeon]|nr:archease [Candidatus Pacearchaeota archaeon]